MTWDSPALPLPALPDPDTAPALAEPVELVGMHLRMSGVMTLGRFLRLSDLVNHSGGYVRVQDAHLLRRNGDETRLTLAEIMVNQDEISFIAQRDAVPAWAGMGADDNERPTQGREPRQLVMFTPGHVVTGLVWVHRDAEVSGFVEAVTPRFVAATDVTARSLSDRRLISHYPFALVNRTQMIAVSEAGGRGQPTEGEVALVAEEPPRS